CCASFPTGGYASVLPAINAPHRRRDGTWARRPWRWWAREPRNYDYLAAAVLFAGTIVFGFNRVNSFPAPPTPTHGDRLVWNPDIIGFLLFLIAGFIAMIDISGTWWRIRGENLGWWIVFVNQVG